MKKSRKFWKQSKEEVMEIKSEYDLNQGLRELHLKKVGMARKNQGITYKTFLGHFFQIYKKKRGNYTQKP